MKTPRNLVLHAPNVHVGGGLTLLQTLYSAQDLKIDWEQVDLRAIDHLPPSNAKRHYVRRSLFSRLLAEWRLWRRVTEDDVVLCFHGLVPIFPLKGEVTVFLQNRILLSHTSLSGYPFRTRLRLLGERWMLKALAGRIAKFIVQTPSMAEQAKRFLGADAPVVVCPFVISGGGGPTTPDKDFDFVYVASADSHKNHLNLLDAWCLLAEQGIRPRLALTVPLESSLAYQIRVQSEQSKLNIINFGQIDAAEVNRLYSSSRALIYPSTTESLGLPLIEASQRGLSILAPELDYVRDIVVPVETFDPLSHVSIARAVKRYLGVPELPQPMFGAEVFLEEVLR